MKKVFGDPAEGELPRSKREFDYTINLTINGLFNTLIILLQPDNKVFVKNYQDSIWRKNYIQIDKSSIRAPLFLVPKKDSKQLVINHWKLNKVTEKDSTPLPKINNTLDQLKSFGLFTKTDFKNPFNQMRIKEGDEWKTALKTKYRIFKYQVMPFSLTNALTTFQKYVNWILSDKLDQEKVAYIDNILVTEQDQVTYWKKV